MEDESKPWHEAKYGEVWMIRVGGESMPYEPALVQTRFSGRVLCFVRGYEEAISVMFWNIQDAYRIHPVSDIKENTNGNRKPE